MDIKHLQPGREVFGTLRIGFALRANRDVHGNIYREVPTLPRVALVDDLQTFVGQVMSNDSVNRTIKLTVSRCNYKGIAVGDSYLPAVIPYFLFKRLYVISLATFPARLPNVFRPTTTEKHTPYRTMTEVRLYGD